MNWDGYRKAVDSLPISPDFQERTEALVHEHNQLKKEYATMKKSFYPRVVSIAAAIMLLIVSAYAASRLLSPGEVADLAKYPMLAEAFESEDAVVLNESVETGDFRVTLTGLVSGEGLTGWSAEVDQKRTYAVVALERLDGTPLDNRDFPFNEYTLTTLVSGYTPWSVNNWTLHASVKGLDQDGIYYYLLDTQCMEMFADHTVYLAFYEGSVPSGSTFTMAEDGTIAFMEDFAGPHALFTLPLDESKADPAAVDAFIENSGFDRAWFLGILAGEDEPSEPIEGDSASLIQQ